MRQSPYFIHNQESVQKQIEGGVLFLLLFRSGSNRWGYVSFYYGCLNKRPRTWWLQTRSMYSQSSGSLKSRVRKSCSLWSSSVESGLASSWFLAVAKQRAVFLGFCHLVSTYVFKFLPPCVSQCLCVLIPVFSLMKTSVFGFRTYSHLVWFTSTNYIYKGLSKYNLFLSFLVDAHFCWTRFNLYPLLASVQPYTWCCASPQVFLSLFFLFLLALSSQIQPKMSFFPLPLHLCSVGPSSCLFPFYEFLKHLFTYLAMLGLCCITQNLSLWGMDSLVWPKGPIVVVYGFSCPTACGILDPEMEPTSLALQGRLLTSGPPGKSFSFVKFPQITQDKRDFFFFFIFQ